MDLDKFYKLNHTMYRNMLTHFLFLNLTITCNKKIKLDFVKIKITIFFVHKARNLPQRKTSGG